MFRRPCPFCGSRKVGPEIVKDESVLLIRIKCGQCGGRGPTAVAAPRADKREKGITMAADEWNKRA